MLAQLGSRDDAHISAQTGNEWYSFAIEKGTASPTILAAIADESATVPSVDSVSQSPDVVNPSGDNISYSPPVTPETDSRYLTLARDPQKNEFELRRLVKKAAEQWGAIKQDIIFDPIMLSAL